MKVLFIITASIAIKKCNKILKQLSSNGIKINWIPEGNLDMALKLING